MRRLTTLATGTVKDVLLLQRNIRLFSTKGHKKTRRIEAIKRELRKDEPPKLPWFVQKTPNQRIAKFLADRERLLSIVESSSVIYQLLRARPPGIPIDAAISKLEGRRLSLERNSWERKNYPRILQLVQKANSALSIGDRTAIPSIFETRTGRDPATAVPLTQPSALEESKEDSDISLVANTFALTDTEDPNTRDDAEPVVAAPETSSSVEAGDPQVQVLNSDNIITDSVEKLDRPVQMNETSALKHDVLRSQVAEMMEIEWAKSLEARRSEASSELELRLSAMTARNDPPSAELGVRLIFALQREKKLDKAWETFIDFTSKRDIWTPKLVESGIVLSGQRGKPERALNLFELAEVKLGRTALPLLYHPTMRACALQRGTTPYTFRLYDRMTKVDFLKPNEQTLEIVLRACSSLGDVARADLLWNEIVTSGEVVPTEKACITMLQCFARGNRMLRAKTMKKDSIKLVTAEDKARLALAGGFTPPKIERTDEAGALIQELNGMDPHIIQARFANQDSWDDEEDDDAGADFPDDDDDAEDTEEVMRARREFEQDEKETNPGKGKLEASDHLLVIPGVTPASLPDNISTTAYQQAFQKVVDAVGKSKLAAAAEPKVEELAEKGRDGAILLRRKQPRMSSAVAKFTRTEPSTDGQRQEANITAANDLIGEAQTKYGLTLSVDVLNAQLKVIAEAMRLRRAIGFLNTFNEKGFEPNTTTYSILIGMLCRAQRMDRAREMFQVAKSRSAVDKLTVGPLIDGLARHGRLDEALQLFFEFKHLGLMERHLRFLRIKLHGDPRLAEFPPDPNYWRSRENLSRTMRSLGRDTTAKKLGNWMNSVARG